MAFAIEHYNGIYENIALRKNSSRVTAPQLFFGNKPILYRAVSRDESPKVSSTSWCCYSYDPSQAITQHNVEDYDWAGYADLYRICAGLDRCKKTDKSSGLTVSIKGIKNSSGSTWTYASLRITRTSISKNYLNVFQWAWFDSDKMSGPGVPFAQVSNDSDYLNVSTASIYAYKEQILPSSGNIDGAQWRLVQRWGTIPKPSSGTYLYVCSPWGTIKKTYGTPTIKGWGVVLEPTNSNSYPV